MSADVATAIATLLEVQHCHHHETRVGVGVEITTSRNSDVMCFFSSGGHGDYRSSFGEMVPSPL